jgi:hypothetical protein
MIPARHPLQRNHRIALRDLAKAGTLFRR